MVLDPWLVFHKHKLVFCTKGWVRMKLEDKEMFNYWIGASKVLGEYVLYMPLRMHFIKTNKTNSW